MKSGRQRRQEIFLRRRARSEAPRRNATLPWESNRIPKRAVAADPEKLWHDNTYGPRPLYYLDVPFSCIDCGKSEVWTAAQQKWWLRGGEGLDRLAGQSLSRMPAHEAVATLPGSARAYRGTCGEVRYRGHRKTAGHADRSPDAAPRAMGKRVTARVYSRTPGMSP
jgi:hypothetical protein